MTPWYPLFGTIHGLFLAKNALKSRFWGLPWCGIMYYSLGGLQLWVFGRAKPNSGEISISGVDFGPILPHSRLNFRVCGRGMWGSPRPI